MKKVILLSFVFLSLNSFAQNDFWQSRTKNSVAQEDLIPYETEVSNYSVFQLDHVAFTNALTNAPMRYEESTSDVLIKFPYSKTESVIFEMYEVQTLAPELAQKFPSIKSYVGRSRDSNVDRVRLTVTPYGIYAKIFSDKGSVYINPMTYTGNYFKVFHIADAIFPAMVCDFESDLTEEIHSHNPDIQELSDDSTMRTFRLAVSTTAEYSTFHVNQAGASGATDAQKKTIVLSAITSSLDRVNGILENELAINLQLIPNNENFIFLNPATDPYTDSSSFPSNGTYLGEVNSYLPGAASLDNYDIGHVLTNRGGGVAFVGSACNDNIKSGGVSGSSSPVGDGIDLTFAHEIGHQLGAFHTFNNSCSGNRTDNSVYETGNGVTIMAYGSTGCVPDVQGFDFDHYHSGSLIQIFNNVTFSCAQTSSISNQPPSITPGIDYIIPRQTPFVLEANATDPDGDQLTYSWEQFDNEISIQPPTSTSSVGPNFRGFQPTTSNIRYFPRMENLLNNQLQTTWEVLPNVSRTMDFVVTARDNNILGGQNVQDLVEVEVVSAAGPFTVTSQNTPNITWNAGDTETVTWNVAGTDANGVNASSVDIIISTNGGISFDHVLLANTPNDGSQDIVVPTSIVGNNCRLMVKGSDNIFFALNQEFFNINATCVTESNTSTVNVPDGNGFLGPMPGTPGESVITVNEDETVKSVEVFIDLSITDLNQIDIELESPSGQIVQLWSKDLCNSSDMNVRLVEGALALPSTICEDSLIGVFSPLESFSAFENTNAQGNWTLRVTDFFIGITATINSWSIDICSATLNTDEFENELFSMFPNPAQDLVSLQLQDTNLESLITIYDLRGRLVKTQSNSNSVRTLDVNISDLNQGIFFVKVNQGDRETIKKLIVQ